MILPTYSIDEELTRMAFNCAMSFRNQVDEIVISEDSRNYREELAWIADIYVIHDNLGYTKNTNLAWRCATGDFAFVVNSDTEYVSGSVGDLCIENHVTSPQILEYNGPNQISGACFMAPMHLYRKHGGFDEHYTFSNADTVLFNNYRGGGAEFRIVNSVQVSHIAGSPGPSRRKGPPGSY